MRNRQAGAVFAAGTSVAAAAIGSLGARHAAQVYDQLDKPAWAPPAGVFGPVWTVLYTAIGVAAWRAWHAGASRRTLLLHAGQMALNAAWPGTFFTVRNRPAALATVLALDAAVTAEIAAVWRTDRVAAALLAPYLAWTLYATALTATVTDPAQTR